MSGLHINYDKSALIPLHCDENWVTEVKLLLKCVLVPLPIRYLGILLGVNPNRIETWQPVLDKNKG